MTAVVGEMVKLTAIPVRPDEVITEVYIKNHVKYQNVYDLNLLSM